jgi:hypothetical protein
MRKPNLLTGTLALTALSFFLGPISRPVIAQDAISAVLVPDVSFAPLELKARQASDEAIRGTAEVAEVSPAFYVAQNDASESPDYSSAYKGERQDNSQTADTGDDGSNDRLIDRIVDPISWLMQFRFRENWNWPVGDSGPDSQQFEFRPTIPFKAWDQVNLLRITVPYDIQGSNAPGLDKVSMFDALIFEPDWGRWGIGPEIRFDPHSTTGQDELQIGPVFGAITKSKHWTVGFICQNFLSGNDSETQIQPILAYKFNEQLALAIGDMQFKYDWNKGQWTQLPLGIELDYIVDFWGQKIQWFVNPQYNFESTSSNSGWTVYVGLTLLVPGA